MSDLKVALGAFRLEVPSLTIMPGEIVGVVGPSGSGKSTLLLALSGFVATQSGVIKSPNGTPLQDLPPEKRGIGLVFQKAALLPHLTVLENVELGLRARGVSAAVRREKGLEALRQLGIEDLTSRKPDQLSGGQAQRVMLARVFVLELSVLLLDEPMATLDPPLRRDLRTLLRDQVKLRGVCCCLVTHDPRDVMDLAEKVVVLEGGRPTFSGTVADGRAGSAWFQSFLA